MRRELGAEASRPGIRERDAAEGLHERWIFRVEGRAGVVNTASAIVEKFWSVE